MWYPRAICESRAAPEARSVETQSETHGSATLSQEISLPTSTLKDREADAQEPHEPGAYVYFTLPLSYAAGGM